MANAQPLILQEEKVVSALSPSGYDEWQEEEWIFLLAKWLD